MKLATLPGPTPDGTLVVVSRDLSSAVPVPQIAATMQHALDHWAQAEVALREISRRLDAGDPLPGRMRFDRAAALAPLPRAYAWLDGSSYLSHVALFRKVAGGTVPQSYYDVPLMYQGGSDSMLGCRAPLPCREEWGADCEGEVGVIIGPVPMRPTREQALGAIRLVTILNDVSLRSLQPRERETGFGWVHCKPPTAFAPVVATPDELGESWRDGKLHGALLVSRNGEFLGRPDAGVGMNFDFGRLIQHAAATRELTAGTIIGSGTVSNEDADVVGVACIAERRFLEQLREGRPITPYLREGDVVGLDMLDAQGRSIFGDIVQRAVAVP
jgi:fumarylacetoacetate (FAA) hydrolase